MREPPSGGAAQRLFEPAGQPPPSEAQAPPKISVVVRKRPLNAQASRSGPAAPGTPQWSTIRFLYTPYATLYIPHRAPISAMHAQPCSHSFWGTQEAERGEFDVMAADMRTGQLIVNEPRVKVDLKQYTERHVFNFDAVLDENVDNDAVYRYILSLRASLMDMAVRTP